MNWKKKLNGISGHIGCFAFHVENKTKGGNIIKDEITLKNIVQVINSNQVLPILLLNRKKSATHSIHNGQG